MRPESDLDVESNSGVVAVGRGLCIGGLRSLSLDNGVTRFIGDYFGLDLGGSLFGRIRLIGSGNIRRLTGGLSAPAVVSLFMSFFLHAANERTRTAARIIARIFFTPYDLYIHCIIVVPISK